MRPAELAKALNYREAAHNRLDNVRASGATRLPLPWIHDR
jgi:hypothetical protein